MSYLSNEILKNINDLKSKNILNDTISYKLKKRLLFNLYEIFDNNLAELIVNKIKIKVTNNLSVEEEELLYEFVDTLSENLFKKWNSFEENKLQLILLYAEDLSILIR